MNIPEPQNIKKLSDAHIKLERLSVLLENRKILLEYSKYDFSVYIWKENEKYWYARVYEDRPARAFPFDATLYGLQELITFAFFEDVYIADMPS